MEEGHPLHIQKRIPLWQDERFLRILGQVIFLAAVTAFLGYLAYNMMTNLQQQGLGLGFNFLNLTAGFDIGEHMIPYDRGHTYLQAFTVGLLNTLLVSGLGIVFATILGI